jgi:tetratricopeptide (TPR) repeat protein
MKTLFSLLIIFFIFSNIGSAKEPDQSALNKFNSYLQIKDFNSSRALIDSLIKSNPDVYQYAYEKSLLEIRQENNSAALKILDSLAALEIKDDRIFVMLTLINNEMKQEKESRLACEKGLELMPNSSRLLCEMGYIYKNRGNAIAAVKSWENGISCDPLYPENYYTMIDGLLTAEQNMYACYYAETFLNLSGDERKSAEVSKKLFNTFFSCLPVKGDTFENFRFTRSPIYYEPGVIDSSDYPPMLVYQLFMKHAYNYVRADNEFAKNIDFYVKVWTEFNRVWSNSIYVDKYYIPLFRLHSDLISKNCFKAYCYMLFSKEFPEESKKYFETHSKEASDLLKIVGKGPYWLSKEKFFSRYIVVKP